MSGRRTKGEKVIFNPKKKRGSVDDTNNLAAVNLDTYMKLVTFRPWVDGEEPSTPAKPLLLDEAIEKRPASLLFGPDDETAKPVILTTAADTTILSSAIEAERGALVQLTKTSHLSEEPHQPYIEAPVFTMGDSTLVDPAPQGGGGSYHKSEQREEAPKAE
ncbi:hypothetical protein GQX73_g5483 [Xylaria multiplex]|uniref:Uncharacterized protein n=1 Tax=Xylaria multiplex TaxID=323545 RepID=A0A7C8MTN4_9PEZI|nr:hypothetical protein GQX73_g5483 [Xylaria multiplex]